LAVVEHIRNPDPMLGAVSPLIALVVVEHIRGPAQTQAAVARLVALAVVEHIRGPDPMLGAVSRLVALVVVEHIRSPARVAAAHKSRVDTTEQLPPLAVVEQGARMAGRQRSAASSSLLGSMGSSHIQ
jgi:hypothetical protein